MAKTPVVNSPRETLSRSRLAGCIGFTRRYSSGGSLDDLSFDVQADPPAPRAKQSAIDRAGPAVSDGPAVDSSDWHETVWRTGKKCFLRIDGLECLDVALDEHDTEFRRQFAHGHSADTRQRVPRRGGNQ